MDEKAYWVGFNLVKGIGAVRVQALIEHFGDVKTAWTASPQELYASGLGTRIVENLLRVRSQVNLELILQNIARQNIQIKTWNDPDYPTRLKEIDQSPPVLYMRGSIIDEDAWAVAIVGTRRVTAYGRQVAEEIARTLAMNGITVVSGLARGVDAVAHDTALKNGGRTLAVLGCGVDRIYPPEHQHLAERVIEQGALVSDYSPGTPPDAINFPPRNRIISGLSLASIVVEAGEESGALITATFAAEQGREVFAVPGNIFSPQSKGSNRLIRDGARPLLSADEVIEALELRRVPAQREARTSMPADALESNLLKVIGYEPTHVDEIRAQSGLPIEKVSATLAMMELKGMVRQVGGMQFVLVRENQIEYQTEPHDA